MLQAIFTRCVTPALLSIALILLTSTSNSRLTKSMKPAEPDGLTSLLNSKELEKILLERKRTHFRLGKTKGGKDVEAYFFPGRGDKRALIIGGMHGSELSSIEVAKEL